MHFQLIYDGEALTNHEIDPKELSTALLSVNNLLQEANDIINEGRVKIKIKVKGSFQTGSFEVTFAISIFDHIKDLLSSNGINELSNAKQILELLFGGTSIGGGFVWLLKKLKGRKISEIYKNSDGTFTVKIDDEHIKIENKVYEMYRNYKIRKNFEDLVAPIAENVGISDVGIQYNNDKKEFCKISKEEAIFFKCPTAETEKLDDDVCKSRG
jgi:hypothetical protein